MRELRQNASAYLRKVQEGEVIEVSMHGKLIARIVPATDSEWDELASQGLIRPPTPGVRLQDIEPLQAELQQSVSEVLMRMREDER